MSYLDIYNTELYQQLFAIFGQALTVVECTSPEMDTIDLSTAIPIKENHQVVAYLSIKKSQMSTDTKDLLSILLEHSYLSFNFTNEKYELWKLVSTKPQEKWQNLWEIIFGNKQCEVVPFYLSLINMTSTDDESIADKVKEIVHAYLDEEVSFIALDKLTYLILHTNLKEISDIDEAMVEIKSTIMTELFLDALIYRGEPYLLPGDLFLQIREEVAYLNQIKQYKYEKDVVTIKDILPQLIAAQISPNQASDWFSGIFKVLRDEHEIILTLKVFFEENLNVSEAAKQLYIHRNSLQYRLDKFYQRTGYDVRRFQDAHIVYQALQVLGTFNKRPV